MRGLLTSCMFVGAMLTAQAQEVLSLDSCRAMALRNNKQLNVSRLKQKVAGNTRKAARTKYLPKLDVAAGYAYTTKEVSLLSNEQQHTLNHLGDMLAAAMTGAGGGMLDQLAPMVGQVGNKVGAAVTDAFQTDTKHLWTGAVMVHQPLYMGGAIVAANKMADVSVQMAATELNQKKQATLYEVDQAYWLVVSLCQKKKLAQSYTALVRKLHEDVQKMIKQGVATKADGLKVDVKVNEAEMQLLQVENGLSLARMALCQLCGLPMDREVSLADEKAEQTTSNLVADCDIEAVTYEQRPELQLLGQMVELSQQATRLVKAAYLPHVMLTGGYLLSNPNVFNGFQRKFGGVWNVGVMVQIPVWNWQEGTYKVRASKLNTTMAMLELDDVREKVELQVAQGRFQLKEAFKRYNMATHNMQSAEENLRCANLGFKEGVMGLTEVMEAQTAWQQAQSQRIDAEVAVNISRVNLKKALGILN